MDRLTRASSFVRHWPLLLALALYLLLALPNLELPGLHYDEALEAATPAALLLNGQPITIVNNGALEFGGMRLPLMVQNHIGAIQIYAAMPFIALLGPTTLALRTMTVLVGAITIVGVYVFAAQVYGRTAAGAAVLWLAAFPSFVFWSRQGIFVTNLAPCFAVWAFAAGARWWDTRHPGMLFLTGLLAGLAVYAKLSALWLLTGTLAWALICWLAGRRAQHAAKRTQRPSDAALAFASQATRMSLSRETGLALLGFSIGILPIILYNIVTGFKTFAVVGSSASTTYLGTSNLNVLQNFVTRVGQFADVVKSGTHLWYLGGPFANVAALVSMIAALAIIGVAVAMRRGRGWQRDMFIPFLTVACVVQSCFTISALWYTHFAIAVWLPALIVGVCFAAVQRASDKQPVPFIRRPAGAVLLFSLVLVVASQAGISMRYHEALRTTGGLSFHATAIEDVSTFLAQRPEHVVALDWGMAAQIEYLTDGQKRVEELYGFSTDIPADFTSVLKERFGRGELYLTHTPNEEAFPRRQAFLDAVTAAGMRAETVNVSIRKDGLPVIEVWRVY